MALLSNYLYKIPPRELDQKNFLIENFLFYAHQSDKTTDISYYRLLFGFFLLQNTNSVPLEMVYSAALQ
jgi:hypothetical protein